MPYRKALLSVCLVFLSILGRPAAADNALGTDEVVVAVIDTGVNAFHQEFAYGGPSDSSDQFVAWWDFSAQRGPAQNPPPGVLWDTRANRADPYDGFGHGTGVAAMAVGLNTSEFKRPHSLAPGYKLAVAKVADDDGDFNGDVEAAIQWAVDTVHADVINLSFGTIVPIPDLIFAGHAAQIRRATDAGALVVVANGNGFANAGIPGHPGSASSTSDVPEALSVGADGFNGTRASTDPEVTAAFSVETAWTADGNRCDDCYTNVAGTSFSSPLVAGMAARLMRAVRDAGRDPTPDYIQSLLKRVATDTIVPPMFEGYGNLSAEELAVALDHAAAGTLPEANPTNELYVESIAGKIRATATYGPAFSITPTGMAPATGPRSIGTSAPEGLLEAEVNQVTLAPGASATVDVTYTAAGPGSDIDVYVFRGIGPSFDARDLITRSTRGSGSAERVTFSSIAGGTFSVVVAGFLVTSAQPYTISRGTFAGEDIYLALSDDGLLS